MPTTTAIAKQYTRHVEEFLVAYGSTSQRNRWHAGVMHDDEIFELVRQVAFLTFGPMPRYVRLERGDVVHKDGCASPIGPEFDSIDADLSPTTARMVTPAVKLQLGKFERAAECAVASWSEIAHLFTKPAITARLHLATCAGCGAQAERWSSLVTVYFAGRPFSREYAVVGDPA